MNYTLKENTWLIIAILVVLVWLIESSFSGFPHVLNFIGIGVLIAVYYQFRTSASHRALIEFKKGNYEKAIQLCDEHAKRFPKDPHPCRVAALACNRLKLFDRAIEYANEGISRGGNLAHLLHLRGSAHFQLFNYEQALEDATASISNGQKEADVFLVKAFALADLMRHKEALETLEVEEIRKNAPIVALICRARILSNMNQYDAAMNDCLKAFETIPPEHLEYGLTARSLIHSNLGKFESAIADINHAMELSERPDWHLVNRSFYYGQLGRLNEAHKDLDHANSLQDFSGNGYIESNRARLLLLEGKIEEALSFTNLAIEKATNRPSILATHGLTLLRNDRADEAKSYLDKAIELDPYESEAHWFRAELHEKMGNTEQAEKDKKIASDYGYIPYL